MIGAPSGDSGRAAGTAAGLELVVAVAENGVIGRGGTLPWRLPADLRRFKSITLGKTVLMGRKTYESIGKALPGRRNVVMTRAADFAAAGCIAVDSLEGACGAAGGGAPLMVIGGGEIYRLCMPRATRIHLTLVHARIGDGDAHFDGWREPVWRETARERHEPDHEHSTAYSFITLERA